MSVRKDTVGLGISNPSAMSPSGPGRAPSPALSHGSSRERDPSVNPDGADPARRVLRIKRLVCNTLWTRLNIDTMTGRWRVAH